MAGRRASKALTPPDIIILLGILLIFYFAFENEEYFYNFA